MLAGLRSLRILLQDERFRANRCNSYAKCQHYTFEYYSISSCQQFWRLVLSSLKRRKFILREVKNSLGAAYRDSVEVGLVGADLQSQHSEADIGRCWL